MFITLSIFTVGIYKLNMNIYPFLAITGNLIAVGEYIASILRTEE
jgi:hypothetical protein